MRAWRQDWDVSRRVETRTQRPLEWDWMGPEAESSWFEKSQGL